MSEKKPAWLDQVATINVQAPAGASEEIYNDPAFVGQVLSAVAAQIPSERDVLINASDEKIHNAIVEECTGKVQAGIYGEPRDPNDDI